MLPSIENTRKDWLELLQELPPGAEIALEVSTSGYFAMSVLEEAGWRDRVHWVHTAGIDSLRKQKTDRLDARWVNDYPQKRFIQPPEIAAVVSFLCKDEFRAINGEDIRVTTGASW